MKLIFLILALMHQRAWGANLCPLYHNVHKEIVEKRILNGIPFKLVSVIGNGRVTYRRIVRIEFDLWSELVEITADNHLVKKVVLNGAEASVCRALSVATDSNEKFKVQILLNPNLDALVDKLKEKSNLNTRLLSLNWERLAKDLSSEQLLVEGEVLP